MIVEMRTYTFAPGTVTRFLAAYRAGPVDIQRRILGNLLGYYVAESGTLNRVVHLWGYPSLDARAERRAALAADQEWATFLTAVIPLIKRQESVFLTPTEFSPT